MEPSEDRETTPETTPETTLETTIESAGEYERDELETGLKKQNQKKQTSGFNDCSGFKLN